MSDSPSSSRPNRRQRFRGMFSRVRSDSTSICRRDDDSFFVVPSAPWGAIGFSVLLCYASPLSASLGGLFIRGVMWELLTCVGNKQGSRSLISLDVDDASSHACFWQGREFAAEAARSGAFDCYAPSVDFPASRSYGNLSMDNHGSYSSQFGGAETSCRITALIEVHYETRVDMDPPKSMLIS